MEKHSKKIHKYARKKLWSVYIRRKNAIKPFLEFKNFEDFCKTLIKCGFT
jgi:hypothetical protein